MKIESIKSELKGYFINRMDFSTDGKDKLCKKISNTDYMVLDNVETPNGLISAYDNLLAQVNNQILDPSVSICSLSKILPVIQGNIFDSYKARERKIEQHIEWCNCVESEDNKYMEDTYLVKAKKPKGFKYWVVDGAELKEINELLLDDTQKENAKRIKYHKLLLKALQDDLINEYEEQYLEEVKKYHNI